MLKDNPILIDVNARRRNKIQKILCVLCKIELNCTSIEEKRYKCPRCKNTYQLGYEILPSEDELESSHEEEGEEGEDSVGLLSANEDEFNNSKEDSDSKGSIPVPKYFKDSPTIKVIDYREE